MKTSPKQTSNRGAAKSPSFLEASHASLSAMPDSDVARQMTVTSGRKCYEQFARFSPLTSLVKTLLDSYQWYSPAVRLRWAASRTYSEKVTAFTKPASSSSSKPSAKTSKVRATPSSRWLFRLVPSAHRIDATASGSSHDTMMLKTPCAFDAKDNLPPKQPKTSSTGTLTQEIVNGTAQRRGLLPTPLTQGLKTCQNGDSKPLKPSLLPTPMDFHGLIPTPTTTDYKGTYRTKEALDGNQGRRHLLRSVPVMGEEWGLMKEGLLITQGASDGGVRAAFNMEQLSHHQKKNAPRSNLSEQIAHKIGGGTSQLNPLFVEEMMGFPIGWTLFPFLTPPNGAEATPTTSPDGGQKP